MIHKFLFHRIIMNRSVLRETNSIIEAWHYKSQNKILLDNKKCLTPQKIGKRNLYLISFFEFYGADHLNNKLFHVYSQPYKTQILIDLNQVMSVMHIM